jgi:toxin ParE1/3/4
MDRELGYGGRTGPSISTQDRMIVLSPDALADVERLRAFLDQHSPDAARRTMAAILMAIERLQEFPDLGMTTGDADIRQIVIRFGVSGYIIRYAALVETGDILVTRIWHGREARI